MSILRIHPKQLLLFLMMGLFIFLSFSLISGLKRRNVAPVFEPEVGKADVGISRFSFVQTHAGKPEWALRAERAEMFEKERKAVLKDVAVTIQTQNGFPLALEGDEGIIDTEKKDFSLRKKTALMEIVLGNGYIVKTSGLKWANGPRALTTDGKATVSGPHVEVEGAGLRWRLDKQELVVFGDVKAVIF
ncbi:MAG: LPS export ABC transporter periplasmic protein LptC [Nitrospiria bacterium]